MFSSLSQYSPKSLLASYLSQNLSSLFNVDPARVETNLIKDAKVVLNDIKIKERRLGGSVADCSHLKVNGSIKQIEFAWVWDSSALIKDVMLTVRGVSIHVTVVQVQDDEHSLVVTTEEACENEHQSGTGNDAPADWRQRYLQQVIDHLTLAIHDVTVSIDLDEDDGSGNQSLVARADGLELVTVQSEGDVDTNAPKLMQTIKLGSIEAWVKNTESSTTHAILEPFGYHANVTRLSGRRFLDGILSGLLVEGLPDLPCASSSIRLHAGTNQIAGLVRLQQVLLLVGKEDTEKAKIEPDSTGIKKSIFHLPFRSIDVIFDNDTQLRLAMCSTNYCTDGTELFVDCIGGVWVDDTPLSKDSRMVLNLVASELLIEALPSEEQYEGDFFYSTHSGDSMAEGDVCTENDEPLHLVLSLDILQSVYCGIQAILPQCSKAIGCTESPASTSQWSVKSKQSILFRFTGKDDDWIEVLAKPLLLDQGPNGISVGCESTVINSNGFVMHIPRVSTTNSGQFVIEDRIEATFDSVDAIHVLQSIKNQVQDFIGHKSSTTFRPSIAVAGCDVTLKEPKLGKIHMTHITATNCHCAIGLLEVKDVQNLSLEASYLEMTTNDQKTGLTIQSIKQLTYKQVDYLTAPAEATALTLQDNMLTVACKDISLNYPQAKQVEQDTHNHVQEEQWASPLSINLLVEHLRMKSKNATSVECSHVNFRMTESMICHLNLKSIRASLCGNSFSCGVIKSWAKVAASNIVRDSKLLLLGQLSLSSASIKLHDITKLSSTDIGSLAKPLSVAEISYNEGAAIIKADTVMFRPKTTTNAKADTADDWPLTFPMDFCLNRLVAMKDFGPDKPGICFDGLKVHMTPDETNLTVTTECNYFQCRYDEQTEFAIKGARMNLCKSLMKDDHFFGLIEAELAMKEVSALSIPGKCSICNLKILFRNEMIEADCDLLHAICTFQSVDQTNGNTREDQMGNLFDIPLSFSIAVKQVIVETAGAQVVCNQFRSQYTGDPETKSLQVYGNSVEGRFVEDSCKLCGVSVSTKWAGMTESLMLAQAEIKEMRELSTGTVSLIEPIRNSKLLFRDGFIVLELDDVQLDATKVGALSNRHTDSKHQNDAQPGTGLQKVMALLANIKYPIGFNANKFRLRSFRSDFKLTNFGIDYVSSLSSEEVEVHIHNDALTEGRHVSANNMDMHLRLNKSDVPDVDARLASSVIGINSIKKAHLKVGELSSLYVEGSLCLTQPLKNVIIVYQDSMLATDIECMKLECFHPGLSLGVRKLSMQVQLDQFDNTIRVTTQCDTVSGHGNFSFGSSEVNLVATIEPNAPASNQPLALPPIGFVSSMMLIIKEIPIFSCQNRIYIDGPIRDLTVRFEEGVILMACYAVSLRQSAKKACHATNDQSGSISLQLPCKMRVSVELVQYNDSHRKTQCGPINLSLDPINQALGFHLIGKYFKSTSGTIVFDGPRIDAAGEVQMNNLSEVKNLTIGIGKAQLTAEFSSSEWSGRGKTETNTEPYADMKLPFAMVPKFDLTLRYTGHLLNINDATISCNEFKGSASTTLSDLANHYVGVVKDRIPYLLVNTDIGGCNLGDSVGVVAGRVLTHTSIVGATVGVAGRDGIGATLSLGKQSRGAAASDKYQFGDFSRGVVGSIRHAAKTGSEMRGDDTYRLGDFTSGTAKVASHYASENRCRLAAAGGSAVGMAAGAALLGPVGFVAGSFIGGSAAKSSMAAVTGDPKKEEIRQTHLASCASSASDATQQRNQVPDILSSDNNVPTPRYAQSAPGQLCRLQSSCTKEGALCATQQSIDLLSSSDESALHYNEATPRRQRADQVAPHPCAQQQQSTAQYQASYGNNAIPTAPSRPSLQQDSSKSMDHQGYHFGDITRGIVAKGKAARGDEKGGYKFGDFTRGLFSK